jgi:hypothetical protein
VQIFCAGVSSKYLQENYYRCCNQGLPLTLESGSLHYKPKQFHSFHLINLSLEQSYVKTLISKLFKQSLGRAKAMHIHLGSDLKYHTV